MVKNPYKTRERERERKKHKNAAPQKLRKLLDPNLDLSGTCLLASHKKKTRQT